MGTILSKIADDYYEKLEELEGKLIAAIDANDVRRQELIRADIGRHIEKHSQIPPPSPTFIFARRS